jgi:hypothetical protein
VGKEGNCVHVDQIELMMRNERNERNEGNEGNGELLE